MIDVSFSRVQTYARCPWLYNLVFNKGWRSGPTAPAAFGQSLHRALGEFYAPANTDRSVEKLFEIYDEVWVNEGFQNTQSALETYQKGRAMLERAYNLQAQRDSEILFTEKEFQMPIDDVNFRGTIDRIDRRRDGSYEVIEYKTSAGSWTQERCDNDLQMTLYAIGVTEAMNLSPVHLSFFFLSNGTSIKTTRSEEQCRQAKNLLSETAAAIKSGDFKPNKAHCQFCEFGRRCEFYQPTKE